MKILVERNSRRGMLYILPLSLGFAVFGIYILQKSQQPLLGWPIIVLFGLIIPIMALFNSGANDMVVIDDSGILDRSLGVGIISWNDIVDVHTEAKYNNNYLCLKLKNSEKYLSQLPHQRRRELELTHELGFTHFNVQVSAAEQDLYYLLDLIQKKIKGTP